MPSKELRARVSQKHTSLIMLTTADGRFCYAPFETSASVCLSEDGTVLRERLHLSTLPQAARSFEHRIDDQHTAETKQARYQRSFASHTARVLSLQLLRAAARCSVPGRLTFIRGTRVQSFAGVNVPFFRKTVKRTCRPNVVVRKSVSNKVSPVCLPNVNLRACAWYPPS